jgi:sodium transport system permease protein
MNWSNVWLILGREVRDQLRDRRTLFVVLVLPLLLYPLLGMSFFQVAAFIEQQPSKIVVVAAPKLADLPPLFDASPAPRGSPDASRPAGHQFAANLFAPNSREVGLLEVHFAEEDRRLAALPAGDLPAAVRKLVEAGKYDAALVFPKDFVDRLNRFHEAIRRRPAPGAGLPTGPPPVGAGPPTVGAGLLTEPPTGRRPSSAGSRPPGDLRSQALAGSGDPRRSGPGDPRRSGAGEPRRSTSRGEPALLAIPNPDIYRAQIRDRSMIAYGRLIDVLPRWTGKIGQANLESAGLPGQTARPFEMTTVDVSPQPGQYSLGAWSKVFPVLLLIWALTGAFYPAIDLCAGEKERGTLETLLSSPAERSEIVVGKLLTVMLFSMATALLNVASMGVTGALIFSALPGFGAPPLLPLLWFPLALVPMAALFSALCLALAALARSSREGQYYLMPLLLVTAPLVVLPMGPGVELTLGNSLIPVSGVVLLLRELMQGNYVTALRYMAPVLLVTLGCCLAAMRWAVDQFNSESVLFREGERFGLGLWLRHLLRDRQPTPTVAAAVFCGLLILLVVFFMGLAVRSPGPGFRAFAVQAVATQLAVIATPALLMTIMFTASPAQTLLLRRPPRRTLAAAALLAVAIHPLAVSLSALISQLFPLSAPVQEALAGVEELLHQGSLVPLLLVTAVTPAICEELAFRGFILSGFRHLGRKWRAIAYTAIFFGFTHTVFQQSLSAMLLGMVLGLIAVQTGSIFPAIVFHMLHNGLTLCTGRLSAGLLDRCPLLGMFLQPEDGRLAFRWPSLVLSAVASWLLLAWFQRLAHPKSSEEELQETIDREGG